jgi:hypothetical protein
LQRANGLDDVEGLRLLAARTADVGDDLVVRRNLLNQRFRRRWNEWWRRKDKVAEGEGRRLGSRVGNQRRFDGANPVEERENRLAFRGPMMRFI